MTRHPTAGDEVIHTTANHPWLTADHGWLVAGALPGAGPMWDLALDAIHTFAVGAAQAVVHNCPVGGDPPAENNPPAIKAGSSGGDGAGKAFSLRTKDAALGANPDTCVYCHMMTDSPEIDHATPKSLGGTATVDNAQVTCRFRNRSKSARDFPVNPPPGYEGDWPPPWWGVGEPDPEAP